MHLNRRICLSLTETERREIGGRHISERLPLHNCLPFYNSYLCTHCMADKARQEKKKQEKNKQTRGNKDIKTGRTHVYKSSVPRMTTFFFVCFCSIYSTSTMANKRSPPAPAISPHPPPPCQSSHLLHPPLLCLVGCEGQSGGAESLPIKHCPLDMSFSTWALSVCLSVCKFLSVCLSVWKRLCL